MTAFEAMPSPQAARRSILWTLVPTRPVPFIAFCAIIFVLLMAVFGPLLVRNPEIPDYARMLAGPSWDSLLGNDDLGRDVLARIVHGSRVSLLVGLLATIVSIGIAVPLGVVAGYFGGIVDQLISRITDLLLAFPFVLAAVLLAVTVGPSLPTVVLALASALVPWLTRIVRGETMVLASLDFVQAAQLDGASTLRVLRRHVARNLMSVVLVQGTLMFPFAVIGEAVLSFLGVGVRPPTATWGNILVDGQRLMLDAPMMAIAPGLCILLTTLAFNLYGDFLRDVFDPRSRR